MPDSQKAPKNIVICCDGTGNQFGDANSNVVKLYTCLEVNEEQIAYYHPGVGTMGDPNKSFWIAKQWSKIAGLAFARGFQANLADAYMYLMKNYAKGDRIYLFGFSRGAYTVRALAGALHMYGLLCPGNEGHLIYLLQMFSDESRRASKKEKKEGGRQITETEESKAFRETFSRVVPIHFVGVWDTVSSIGWIYDPVKLLFDGQNPIMRKGRHAVSVDERRCFYQANLWGCELPLHKTPVLKEHASDSNPHQDIVQAWFPGVHSDIGGSYTQSESGPAMEALRWILDEALSDKLLIHPQKRDAIFGLKPRGFEDLNKLNIAPHPPTKCLHPSLKGLWWLLEFFPHKYFDPKGDLHWRLIPWPHRRELPDGALLHPILRARLAGDPDYKPKNLARASILNYSQSPVPLSHPDVMDNLKAVDFGVYRPAPAHAGRLAQRAGVAALLCIGLAALLVRRRGVYPPAANDPGYEIGFVPRVACLDAVVISKRITAEEHIVNRTEGFATATVLLIGAWLRPGGSPATPAGTPQRPPHSRTEPAANPPKNKGDGPWRASCKYWEPARSLDQYGKDAPDNLKFTLTDKDGSVNSTLVASGGEVQSECEASGDVWGIPPPSNKVHPDITAIIAVVPDPVHTHLALEYDRAIDALMQAGADNGYLRSFYWLPWKQPTEAARTGEPPTAEEIVEQNKRDEMPGLIVLKHVAEKGEEKKGEDIWTSYDRVIYLFLVGESPASGMNGMQMRNALRDEEDLKQVTSSKPAASFKKSNASKESKEPKTTSPSIRFSMLGSDDLQIIGSGYSGAAASLREAAEQARAYTGLGVKTVHIAGATSTSTANDLLSGAFLDGSQKTFYVSFGENVEFEQCRTMEMLRQSGYADQRFAVLVEDGTLFGETSAKPSRSADRPLSCQATINPQPLVIRFPREISLLRNAQTNENGNSAPSPYLHLTLKDSVADDTIPQFSREQTPLSQEAALMAIQRELLTYHVRFLAIDASDILDKIFLAKFLHRACPDIRLVFLDGGDLLLEREAENQPYIGSLTVTPYDLTGLWPVNGGSGTLRAFSDSQSEAIYNAASYTFQDPLIERGDLVRLKNLNSIAMIESVADDRSVRVARADQHRSIQQAEILEYPLGTPYNPRMADFHAGSLLKFTTQAEVKDIVDANNIDVAIGSATMPVPRSDVRKKSPILAGYQESADSFAQKETSHASLWATVVGIDGYYPLGIVSHCASEQSNILPSFVNGDPTPCKSAFSDNTASDELKQFKNMPEVHPSLLWKTLSILLGLYCVAHTVLLWVADYWSPFTRDLAIRENDQPQRRSVYMNIAAVMLFSMAWVLVWPVFAVAPAFDVNPLSRAVGRLVLLAAFAAVLCTLWKTWSHSWHPPLSAGWRKQFETLQNDRPFYRFFNAVALLAWIVIPAVWCWICRTDTVGFQGHAGTIHTKYGLFFSYRCLHPDSGVSPVMPVLLVLLGWYLWAVCQTYRLRFSKANRPQLPRRFHPRTTLFISDDELNDCANPQHSCLFSNIGCLLITRELLHRFRPMWKGRLSLLLATFFVGSFLAGVLLRTIQSVDRVLLQPGEWWSTPYEGLITGLLVPLGVIALAGWLRAILIWGSLRRGLLEPLERSPLRGAFTRLKGLGWMAMMRETGLHLRWKDMARTSESIRQIAHNEEIRKAVAASDGSLSFEFDWTMKIQYAILCEHLETVGKLSRGEVIGEVQKSSLLETLPRKENQDFPTGEEGASLAGIHAIERDYAAFCELLLQYVLIPYWLDKRGGFVEGEATDLTPIHARRKPKKDDKPHDPLELHTGSTSGDPEYIRLAEELLAIRYVSLIRAVLGNLRYLMTFVTAIFVLTIVAWNSYPFQPRQLADWVFTLMFLLFGGGMLWVLAQMHRNAILSRITDTSPNELGLDFYWRLVTLGAIPLLTWLAYQFPQIGSGIFRTLQPGLSVVK